MDFNSHLKNEAFSKKVDAELASSEVLFNDICESIETEGRNDFIAQYIPSCSKKPHTAARAEKIAAKKLGKKERFVYEGYHLISYTRLLFYQVKSDNVTKSIPELPQTSVTKLNTALRAEKFQNGYKFISNIVSANSVGNGAPRKVFEAIAEAKGISLAQCFLGFLQFCDVEGRYIRALKTSSIQEQISILEQRINKARNQNLEQKIRTKIPLIVGDDNWLSPLNHSVLKFTGRDYEISKLNEFCNDTQQHTLLWAIEAPTGEGKTRLVTHWACSNSIIIDWEVIYLSSPEQFKKETLNLMPSNSKLLVIIDFSFRTRKLLQALLDINKFLKVRILFLGTQFCKPLKMDKRWTLSKSVESSHTIPKILYAPSPLTIIRNKETEEIASNILLQLTPFKKGSKELSQAIEAVKYNDYINSPLLVSLYAKNISGNSANAHALRKVFHDNYLKGDITPWKSAKKNGILASTVLSIASSRGRFNWLYFTEAGNTSTPDNTQKIKNICQRISSGNGIELFPFDSGFMRENYFLAWLIEIHNFPKLKKASFDLFSSGDVWEQLEDSEYFIKFMRRTCVNVLSEWSHSTNASERNLLKNMWVLLKDFLRPENFKKGTAIRKTVVMCQIEACYQSTKFNLPYNLRVPLFSIDPSEIYSAGGFAEYEYFFLESAVYYSMLLYELRSAEHDQDLEEITSALLIISSQLIEETTLANSFIAECLSKSTLVIAAEFGFHKIVKKLSSQTSRNNEGVKQAILLACANNNLEILNEIITHGNSIDFYYDGTTPLVLSILSRHSDIISYLLERTNDINLYDNEIIRPLTAACISQNITVTLKLLEMGANVNEVDYYGNSPIYYAYISDNSELCSILLKHGAYFDDIPRNNGKKIENPIGELAIKISSYKSIRQIEGLPPFSQNSSL